MKIAFFEINDLEKKYIQNDLKGHKLFFSKEKINEVDLSLIENAEIISVFIYSNVNKKILSKLKKLKAIVTRSTGIDHIDIGACKKKKIKIYNVPDYGQNTVAEHTFALILSLSRKINKAYDQTTKGNFSLENLEGFDLKGKTLGIIGMGSIGRHVARIANGFEMEVVAYDPFPNKSLEKKFNFRYTSLRELLKNSDVVSLHCPYTKKNHHLINANNLKIMKKNSLLINTARGDLIDTPSLVKALSEKRIGGAGLDVLEGELLIKEEAELLSLHFPKKKLETLIEDHLLLTFDNVIITPHIAFYSEEALKRILNTALEDIQAIIKNKKCDGEVKI